ncbi:hypothetical protein [Streptomyces nitrosporeus]|uniref:hypothetical protein n=1 Tax=Streptomyces nitrosporeus TaxID=28894 RepID=UPI00142EE6DB|nr:hypothetical protein [Streptomyces nitrosporeus]GGY81561.1 hypothetical protein GCM10010327_10350 [Streptomyces nitrosporeus]
MRRPWTHRATRSARAAGPGVALLVHSVDPTDAEGRETNATAMDVVVAAFGAPSGS